MKTEENDPLVDALHTDDAAGLERQLAEGRKSAERFHFGRTPLHIAAESGARDCARVLLSRGADLEAHDEAGQTPLFSALQSGQAALAAELIAAGALLHYRFKREDTPEIREELRKSYDEVQRHARELHPDIYKILDSVMSGTERKDWDQETTQSLIETSLAESEIHAVHHCANVECLKLLAAQPGVTFNIHDGGGYWPLKTFAESGDAAAVEWLLQNGAAPNFTSTGETALHAAVSRDHVPCARLLIHAGANVNQQDVDGSVPLASVASEGMLDLLLAHGADPTIGDQCTFKPSHWVKDSNLKSRLKKLEKERARTGKWKLFGQPRKS
ncbi:MAG TPA: ankyrin repeat domain-containing protein [Methylomirabilota bacterium]|nr:ankyrin repeat domain-containing protein [Methylomirabilota bacterium]